jgi:hypothetical protein
MGINVVYDSDVNAFGTKSPGQIMASTFKVYDEAGVIAGQSNELGLEKDMIFANGSDLMQAPHYFQNALFVQGYINAFLQLHLNGHSTYRRFFQWSRQKSGGHGAVSSEFVIAGVIFHPSRVQSSLLHT